MDNQKKQRERLSARDRLSQISHHFLSEDEPPGATDAPLFFVVVPPVAAAGPPALSPSRLGRAFVRARTAVAVADAHRSGLFLMYPHVALEEHAAETGRNGRPGEFRTLLERARGQDRPNIVLTAETPAAAPGDFLVTLIAVPWDREGMRRAFVRLKELAGAAEVLPSITGAAVCGTMDPVHAERIFLKFSFAAQRFIGLTVTSYGCFPRDAGRGAGGGPQGTGGLRNVVNLLLQDWRAWRGRTAEWAPAARCDTIQNEHLRDTHEPATESRIADAR